MLDWLKTILGEAYTEEIDKKISDEVGKGFVSRPDFNAAVGAKKQLEESLKERDAQLEALKVSTGDVAALKEQIAALQVQNSEQAKEHEEDVRRIKIDSAVETALAAAKAKNPKAVKALLELEKAELSDDGSVKGLEEQIKKLIEAQDSSFLFEASGKPPALKGAIPAEGGDAAPAGAKPPKEMSYDELCTYLTSNPDAKLN